MTLSAKKIDQRYQIIKPLSDDGASQTFVVEDAKGQRLLLKFLKIIQKNYTPKEVNDNFKREFALLKEFNHPHIAPIQDFGYDTTFQKNYYTTEFVEGVDIVTACEGLSLAVIEKVIVQVLRALNYIHSRGVYHLDLKPQNILVTTKDGVPDVAKICNFGTARFSLTNKLVGAPAYMAPEMIEGTVIDGRADLYSFGVIIYRTLTGENPFVAKNPKETLQNHLSLKPKPPSEINHVVPQYWDVIIERLLEKNPNDRYAQASMVIRDLGFLSGKKFDIETEDTKLSYVPENGALVARENEWRVFTELFTEIFDKQNQDQEKLLIVAGDKGTGKSRFIEEVRHYAQLKNVPTLTVSQFDQEERLEGFVLTIDSNECSAEEVNTLLQRLSGEPCLIVWATDVVPANWTASQSIVLKDFSKSQLHKYLEVVTGLKDVPLSLVEAVFNRTNGNPMFVAEYVKALIANGYLYDEAGRWSADSFKDRRFDFSKIKIPDSIEDCLQAKFKSLNRAEQDILKFIAANKKPLSLKHLQMAVESAGIELLANRLARLGVLETTVHGLSYYFKNISLAESIYRSLGRDEARALHQKLSLIFTDVDKDYEQFLFHKGYAESAEDYKQALFDLGERHFKKPDYASAIDAYKKIVQGSSKTLSDLEIKAFSKLGKAYIASAKIADAVTVFSRLKDLLSADKSRRCSDDLFQTYASLVAVLIKAKDYKEAQIQIAAVSRHYTSSTNKLAYELIFKNSEAYILLKKGQLDAAEKIYTETDAIWSKKLTVPQQQLVFNNRLFEVYSLKNKNQIALDYCLNRVDLLKKINSRYGLGFFYFALGAICTNLMNNQDDKKFYEESLKYFHLCEEIADEIQDYDLKFRALNATANVYAMMEQNQKALEYYIRALNLCRRTSEFIEEAIISYNIARLYLIQEKHREAYSYNVYSLNTLEGQRGIDSHHAKINIFLGHLQLASIYIDTKQPAKAHKSLDQADLIYNEVSVLERHEYWKHINRARAYFFEGDRTKAMVFYEKAQKVMRTLEEKQYHEKISKELAQYSAAN